MFVMSMSSPFSTSTHISSFLQDTAPERQTGRKAQISNIMAAKVRRLFIHPFSNHYVLTQCPKTVADVIRTCLGPKAMLKMILDPMGGILSVFLNLIPSYAAQ